MSAVRLIESDAPKISVAPSMHVDSTWRVVTRQRREEVFLSCRLAEPRDFCAGVDHPLLDLEDKSWRRSYQHTGVVQLAVYSCSSV